jgi:hypothetical protein
MSADFRSARRRARDLVVLAFFSNPRLQRQRRDLNAFLFGCILVLAACRDATAQSSRPYAASTTQAAEVVAGYPQAQSEGLPKKFLDMTPGELAKAVLELKHLQPAENQDVLPQILTQVGATVAAFFETFSNVTCKERVISAVATPMRSVEMGYDLEFSYVALPVRGADKTNLQEYRTDSKGAPVQPKSIEGIFTVGFVSYLKHFHPDYQSDSRFRYLGREALKGRDTYVVAFAQRPEVARHPAFVEFGNQRGSVFLQGVAWIDPTSFRILRLRTDIQQPELKIGLQNETTEIEYSEVTFRHDDKTFWLPREVAVAGRVGRYSFHNRHHYSDYRLYVVNAEEAPKSP